MGAAAGKHKPKKIKDERKDLSSVYSLSAPPGRDIPFVPSRVTHGGSTSARSDVKYTGDKIMGIMLMQSKKKLLTWFGSRIPATLTLKNFLTPDPVGSKL